MREPWLALLGLLPVIGQRFRWNIFTLPRSGGARRQTCSPAGRDTPPPRFRYPAGQRRPARTSARHHHHHHHPPTPPAGAAGSGRGCGGRPGLPSPAPRGPGRAARSPGNPPRRAAARPGPARPRPARWPRRSGLARGGVRRSPRGRRARWLPPSPSPRSAGALLRPEPALSRRGVTRRRPEQGRR